MADKIKYTFDNELVRVTQSGVVDSETFNDLIALIVKDRKNLPSEIKILMDARRATFGSRPEDLKSILRKIKEHYKKFDSIKFAIILQNPYETAIGIIMQEMLREIPSVVLRVFSTEQAAVKWLK
ncbi:MAG: STAS/SEC14 domain-containing protein [Bacteroidales bacterium]